MTTRCSFSGYPYLEKEEKRPLSYAIRYYSGCTILLDTIKQEFNNELSGDDQQGFTAAWLRFAYDLYTIWDNSKLERRLKK